MTDTFEIVALKALIERARNHKMTPQERFDQMVSFVSEGVDKAAVRARLIENAAVPQEIIDAAIATDRRALIEGAGELRCVKSVSFERDFGALLWTPYDQAAATIAALKAEIERLTEREAQVKLDGVKAGIEASAVQCEWPPEAPVKVEYQRGLMTGCILCERAILALDAEAIAKGIITADALSDPITGDADLIVPDTLADSDGDDGA